MHGHADGSFHASADPLPSLHVPRRVRGLHAPMRSAPCRRGPVAAAGAADPRSELLERGREAACRDHVQRHQPRQRGQTGLPRGGHNLCGQRHPPPGTVQRHGRESHRRDRRRRPLPLPAAHAQPTAGRHRRDGMVSAQLHTANLSSERESEAYWRVLHGHCCVGIFFSVSLLSR